MVIPCLYSFLFTVPSSVFSELLVNKKRTRTLSHREPGSGTNCMVDGTGLERIYVDFVGYNSHIKPDYSSFFVRIFPKIGKKNTLEKGKVWSKVWSNYRMASRLCVSASMTLNRRYS